MSAIGLTEQNGVKHIMQCPNCSKYWETKSNLCHDCNIDMKASLEQRITLADSLFGRCVCDDGSCDWCSVYYSDEKELQKL